MTTTRNAGARGATLVTLLVLVGIVGLLPGLASPPARAAIELDITKGQVQPLPIAIPGFIGAAPDEGKFGADIATIIANNLDRSGLFRPLPAESYIEQISNFDQQPRFGDWRTIQAQALVTGQVVMQPDGQAQGRVPPVGRLFPDRRCWASSSSPRRRTGAASAT